jgi:hypothetical protein
MPVTTTENEQVIEAVVSGPAPANRLYTCIGKAVLNMQAQANVQPVPETWTVLVGPALPVPGQFIRAIASVSVLAYQVSSAGGQAVSGTAATTISSSHSLDIQSVEADWDDESRQTELRIEVAIGAGSGTFTLGEIGYTATVLAEVT